MPQMSKAGSFTGTGAAINIELGFVPEYMIVWNDTDGDESWEYFDGMAAGSARKIATDGTQTKITSNGFTQYTGTAAGYSKGMTVGSALSESGKTFRYRAVSAND